MENFVYTIFTSVNREDLFLPDQQFILNAQADLIQFLNVTLIPI